MTTFSDAELLALHREIVAIPSLSGQEGPLVEHLRGWFAARGTAAERIGDNLVARFGATPFFCLNTHLDTVPASAGWSRGPHDITTIDGRVYGLGSNDAKASAAAMIAAFLRLRARPEALPGGVLLTLVAQEEVGGKGTEALLPELVRRGIAPAAAVIGEPTGLDVAVAQKGLLVMELTAAGDACHAAHGRALGARNAIRELARDLVALEEIDLGPAHPLLGPPTLEPTIVQGGTARNAVPDRRPACSTRASTRTTDLPRRPAACGPPCAASCASSRTGCAGRDRPRAPARRRGAPRPAGRADLRLARRLGLGLLRRGRHSGAQVRAGPHRALPHRG